MGMNVTQVAKCRGCGSWPVAQVYTDFGKPVEVTVMCPNGCATGADTFLVKWVVEREVSR